jgi:hypothetical protein
MKLPPGRPKKTPYTAEAEKTKPSQEEPKISVLIFNSVCPLHLKDTTSPNSTQLHLGNAHACYEARFEDGFVKLSLKPGFDVSNLRPAEVWIHASSVTIGWE